MEFPPTLDEICDIFGPELNDVVGLSLPAPTIDSPADAGFNWPTVTAPTAATYGQERCFPKTDHCQPHPDTVNGLDLYNEPGSFNFKLQIAETQANDMGTARRDSNFVYSAVTNRLYCKAGELVPLQVVLGRQAPEDLVLNLFVVFDEQTYRAENVEACPHHRVVAESAKLGNPNFIVRAANDANAEYVRLPAKSSLSTTTSPENDGVRLKERHMLRIPVVPAASGNSIVLLKFMCRNSCPGGINRRTTSLVAMLTSPNSKQVFGMSFIKVKVVTCPVRDARRDLEKVQQHGGTAQATQLHRTGLSLVNGNDRVWADASGSQTQQRGGKRPLAPKVRSGVGREAAKRDTSDAETGGASSDTEEIFTLVVRGKKNFQYLTAMAEGLELRRQAKNKKKRKEVKGGNSCISENPIASPAIAHQRGAVEVGPTKGRPSLAWDLPAQLQ